MERNLARRIGGLCVLVALLALPARAQIVMPEGSKVWMKLESNACPFENGNDCAGSNQMGPPPPNGIPLASFGDPFYLLLGFSEVLPHRVRALSRTRSSLFHRNSFEDTYTVHGSATGSFPVTVTLGATGTVSSVTLDPTFHMFQIVTVILEIGTFNPSFSSDPPLPEQFRVEPFSPSTTAFQSFPNVIGGFVSHPVSVATSHTLTTSVGSQFTLAYGVSLGAQAGLLDLSGDGAQIAFTLPEGVWLTSDRGGVFGDPPAPQVPLPPLALGWTAVSLAALGCRSLRRRSR